MFTRSGQGRVKTIESQTAGDIEVFQLRRAMTPCALFHEDRLDIAFERRNLVAPSDVSDDHRKCENREESHGKLGLND